MLYFLSQRRRFQIFTVEFEIYIAVGKVGGQKIEIVKIGTADVFLDIPLQEFLGIKVFFRTDAKIVGRGTLGIEVAQQGRQAVFGSGIGKIYARCGFADTTLTAIHGDYFHIFSP